MPKTKTAENSTYLLQYPWKVLTLNPVFFVWNSSLYIRKSANIYIHSTKDDPWKKVAEKVVSNNPDIAQFVTILILHNSALKG